MATQAQNAAPSTDAQIAAFKGLSIQDGKVDGAQDGVVDPGEAEHGDDGAAHVDGGEPQQTARAPKKVSAEVQGRIDKAVAAQRRAERAANTAQAELRAISERLARFEGASSAQQQPLTTQQSASNLDPKAPDPAKYQFGELDARYVADLARYSANQVIEADRQQRTAETAQTAKAREAEQFRAFNAKAVEKFPDFQEVVLDTAARQEWALSDVVAKLALQSDFGHDVFYDLARDPTEAQRVASLTPVEQARWFGRREAFYSAKSPAANGNGQAAPGANAPRQTTPLPVRTTQAPPPPQTRLRGGGNPQPVQADTTDFAAFERLVMGDRRK